MIIENIKESTTAEIRKYLKDSLPYKYRFSRIAFTKNTILVYNKWDWSLCVTYQPKKHRIILSNRHNAVFGFIFLPLMMSKPVNEYYKLESEVSKLLTDKFQINS